MESIRVFLKKKGRDDALLKEYMLKREKLNSSALIPIIHRKEKKLKKVSKQEYKKLFKLEYVDYLEFQNSAILEWVSRKCKKRLKRKHFARLNKWILSMYSEDIGKERLDLTVIKWINSYLGYGVFALKKIPSLTYIGEYTGLIRKRNPRRDAFNHYVFRYVTGPKNTPFVIDAKEKGSFTRFINHSDEPNLSSRWVIKDGICHIILFTNKTLLLGEQLTYDYGQYYWKSRTNPLLL